MLGEAVQDFSTVRSDFSDPGATGGTCMTTCWSVMLLARSCDIEDEAQASFTPSTYMVYVTAQNPLSSELKDSNIRNQLFHTAQQ